MYAQFRPSIKFALLWIANAAILAAIYFLADIEFPILLNSDGIVKAISALSLILAVLETALVHKLKGE